MNAKQYALAVHLFMIDIFQNQSAFPRAVYVHYNDRKYSIYK